MKQLCAVVVPHYSHMSDRFVLTQQLINGLHGRDGLEDRGFEKVTASHSLLKCGLCTVLYREIKEKLIGKPCQDDDCDLGTVGPRDQLGQYLKAGHVRQVDFKYDTINW